MKNVSCIFQKKHNGLFSRPSILWDERGSWIPAPSLCSTEFSPAQPNKLNPWGLLTAIQTPKLGVSLWCHHCFPRIRGQGRLREPIRQLEERVKWMLTGDVFISQKKLKEVKPPDHTSPPFWDGANSNRLACFQKLLEFTFQEISPRACLLGFSKSFIIE